MYKKNDTSEVIKNGMQSVAIHYVQPVTFYTILHVFIFRFFQIYPKQLLGLVTYGSIENFKRYLLMKKYFNHKNNRGDISKILTVEFFMRHPLIIEN